MRIKTTIEIDYFVLYTDVIGVSQNGIAFHGVYPPKPVDSPANISIAKDYSLTCYSCSS